MYLPLKTCVTCSLQLLLILVIRSWRRLEPANRGRFVRAARRRRRAVDLLAAATSASGCSRRHRPMVPCRSDHRSDIGSRSSRPARTGSCPDASRRSSTETSGAGGFIRRPSVVRRYSTSSLSLAAATIKDRVSM